MHPYSHSVASTVSPFRRHVAVVLIFVSLLHTTVSADSSASTAQVRPSAVAGMFYKKNPETLKKEVRTLLHRADGITKRGKIVAGVVPHAGYTFSGRCAGSFYGLLKDEEYDRVIILAPSHHASFHGIVLPDRNVVAHDTPLGRVPIDVKACARLLKSPGFSTMANADRREHSIEVQLPFLQEALGPFKLIPMLCGRITPDEIENMADAILPHVNSRTLVLASSDFTHYGPRFGFVPFRTDVRKGLYEWLTTATRAIEEKNCQAFERHLARTSDTICGRVPIAVLLAVLSRAEIPARGETLDCYTSGDVVGDFKNCVSYGAVAFSTMETPPTPGEKLSKP